MPKIAFPVLPDGLLVDALIGLDGATTAAHIAAGQPVPAPLFARGEIDTGSNVTAVSAAILRCLIHDPAGAVRSAFSPRPSGERGRG
jgi:hypothetical protein